MAADDEVGEVETVGPGGERGAFGAGCLGEDGCAVAGVDVLQDFDG